MSSFSDEAVEKLVKAGEIAARVRDRSAGLVRSGSSAREVCEKVEELIRDMGAVPAFPCNFSVNEVAAHYTPGIDDDVKLVGMEVVKVDIGVAVDGYIADTAVTVDLSGLYERLLEASRAALERVVAIMKPNVRIYDIGRTVESTIRSYGFKPIRNLTGHTIDRWRIHAGTQIPNYPDRTTFHKRLKPGTLVAVEPFATNGRGFVREGGITNIYSYTGRRGKYKLSSIEEEILQYIIDNYRTLPFTPRWLLQKFKPEEIEPAIKSLVAKGILYDYPILVEASRGMVSQFEHTFLILKDRVIVTTCPECNTG
ncbi:MAG: type II methionyl aminopeptidase [Desulfurococcales archaeon]|nr:type II methionyl aminopeptidase [Desulfurococcales archaeon]